MPSEETHTLFARETHILENAPLWTPPQTNGCSLNLYPPMTPRTENGKSGGFLQVEVANLRSMTSHV